MPAFSTLWARGLAELPGLPLTSPSYPTADKVVPVYWWDVATSELDALESRRLLRGAQAAAHGSNMSHAGSNHDVKMMTASLERRAFPTLWRRRVVPEA